MGEGERTTAQHPLLSTICTRYRIQSQLEDDGFRRVLQGQVAVPMLFHLKKKKDRDGVADHSALETAHDPSGQTRHLYPSEQENNRCQATIVILSIDTNSIRISMQSALHTSFDTDNKVGILAGDQDKFTNRVPKGDEQLLSYITCSKVPNLINKSKK